MPNLDIVSTFNEVDLDKHPEYAPRRLKDKPFTFVDQMVALGRSATIHLPGAQLWAVHTEPISDHSQQRLRQAGWTTTRGDREPGPRHLERLHDRLAGYRVGHADHLLLLDSDTIFVRRPKFTWNSPVQVGYAGNPVFDHKTWNHFLQTVGLDDINADELSARAFNRYFIRGKKTRMPFFNNGAVLVTRSEIGHFEARIRRAKDQLLASPVMKDNERLGHFFDQVCLSLAVHQTEGWSLLPPGVNALSSKINLKNPLVRRRISHLHYLKGVDLDLVVKYYGRYFQDFR